MRYWWVNQNQTYRAEVRGSFMWSPKRNANGARNQFYENMRSVAPGDVIFSFCDTRIKAIGVVTSPAETAFVIEGLLPGSVPTVVEKEKWRNLLLTKHIAINGEGGTPCRRGARRRT